MEYNVNPDTKTPLMLVGLTGAAGLLLALIPTFNQSLPSWVFHIPSMLVFLICILLLSRFVLTDYTYQLYDASNTMSPYPKFNVYRVRKSGSRMVYCIPFNNVILIKKKEPKYKAPAGIPRENLCASMTPQSTYILRYLMDDHQEEIYIECNDVFAAEIAQRVASFSEVTDLAVE